jgi:hypothetical protein
MNRNIVILSNSPPYVPLLANEAAPIPPEIKINAAVI